jgi:hypothetical protein
MDLSVLARVLIGVGIAITLFGALLLVFARIPGVGSLPGDLLIRRDGFTLYFPIVTCLLGSIILTIVVNVIARIAGR